MVRAPCSSELGLKKGPWSPEEDQILIDHVEKHGHGSWRALPKIAGLNRCGKSCRLRWINYLKPDIKRGNFSEDEERTIINLHSVLGNKWSRISEHLPGRTDNEIKNFWNTKLRKKLFQTGLDPKTHKPITPNLNLLFNLSHLLSSPSNLINAMTNVDPLINAYRYQEEAINQLAQLQLVHNILQVANMCQLPNLAPTKSTMDPSQEWVQNFRNGELLDHSDMNGLSHGTCSGNTLPGLVTTSPESSSIVNQMNYTPPMHNAPTSCLPESDVFEGWEKLVDDEAISSFLRDIIVD